KKRPPRLEIPGGRPVFVTYVFYFYLVCRYNRHSAAERHSQCSHICSNFVYKNHNKMKKRLDHASGFATDGLGAGRNKAAGKFSRLAAWVPFFCRPNAPEE